MVILLLLNDPICFSGVHCSITFAAPMVNYVQDSPVMKALVEVVTSAHRRRHCSAAWRFLARGKLLIILILFD
jgi:hypothetical protein